MKIIGVRQSAVVIGLLLLGAVGFGNSGTAATNTPTDVTNAAITPSGNGMWLVERNGTVYASGDAVFYGDVRVDSSGTDRIAGIAATPDGKGYWLAGHDGNVYAFGNAPNLGRVTVSPGKNIRAITAYRNQVGFVLTGTDGSFYPFVAPPVTTTTTSPTTTVPPTTTTTTTTTVPPTTTTTVPTGGWPDATNTGPRFAITNTINSDYNTTSDGQIISGTEIKGRLVIKNANVTVTDSIVRGDLDAGGGNGWFGIQNENNHPGLVVKYTEVGKAAAGTLDVGIQAGNATVDHANIHTSDGIQASGGATLTNNYIHDLVARTNVAHMDGIQMFSGPGKTTIQHNWIDCTDHSQWHLLPNGSVFFQGNYNPILVDNNHLEGGGYLFRLEAGGNGATVTNNPFKLTDARGWGNSLVQGQIVAQSGNVDDNTGKSITL